MAGNLANKREERPSQLIKSLILLKSKIILKRHMFYVFTIFSYYNTQTTKHNSYKS
nr:MAG TPA: hypothetical protein [Caudoviricetes sp.]